MALAEAAAGNLGRAFRVLTSVPRLVAMSRAHADAFAARGAPPAQYGSAGLGFHPHPEPVGFRTVAAVGLKCTFGHDDPLLFLKKIFALAAN
jgi:hypothetical protein